MAESAAAPSAPAPAADAAAPAALPGAPDVATATTPSAPSESRIRPIPRLPGVFPDGDPFTPDDDAARATPPSPTAGGERLRGPDGRFVASPSSATTPPPTEGEHTLEPATQPDTPPPQKFKVAGEEYDSQEAFEQHFKSLRGQFKPLQSLARQLGGMDKIPSHLREAAESARAWKAEAESLRAQLQQPQSQTQQPQTPDPATVAAADEADIDWDLYAEISKLATEQGQPQKAQQWLIDQVRKSERTRMERLLDERMAPFHAQQTQQAVHAHTEALFGSLAGYTNADGSPAFPELHDQAAAQEVGSLWASLGLPPEAALTPQGAVAAIAVYRLMKQSRSQAESPTSAAAPAPPLASVQPPADIRSAASLSDGRPTLGSIPPANGAATPSAEAARILSAMRAAHMTTRGREAIGFEP